jgi:hypothetical protein
LWPHSNWFWGAIIATFEKKTEFLLCQNGDSSKWFHMIEGSMTSMYPHNHSWPFCVDFDWALCKIFEFILPLKMQRSIDSSSDIDDGSSIFSDYAANVSNFIDRFDRCISKLLANRPNFFLFLHFIPTQRDSYHLHSLRSSSSVTSHQLSSLVSPPSSRSSFTWCQMSAFCVRSA